MIDKIKQDFFGQTRSASTMSDIQNIRVKFLGKNGELTAALKELKNIEPAERGAYGKRLNDVKTVFEETLSELEARFSKQELDTKLKTERIDISIDSPILRGNIHPETRVTNDIIDIFLGLGFSVYDGREIETDYYNFEALNLPADHPAREMQDTFYITDKILLRTQTSTTQVRIMETSKPPIKMLNPGRVYRSDAPDATHSPMFHQIEGLVVDKNITLCDLKGVLDLFAKKFFGEQTKTRMRPSFFPFTEPSVEIDATCGICGGKGCNVCKGTGWLEILGAGMVNRRVLKNCGIDPDLYSGFAFGIGVDRTTNIKYGITDMRMVFENDIRFLKQFK